ncbi:MAG: Tex family protein [Bradymonadales bacterium]
MTETQSFAPASMIAEELQIPLSGVEAVLRLFAENATVPFIARYRKEATGGLDEVQIRQIEERHQYLVELEERRGVILKSIEEQGKLSEDLKKQINAAMTKSGLEDLYLPYKPKRRTRATIAKEKGLQPLADIILSQALDLDPYEEAAKYVNVENGVNTVEEAIKGAQDIVAEAVSESAKIREFLRNYMQREGEFSVEATEKGKAERTKFEQYYDFKGSLTQFKSHQYLAIRRGENEGALRAEIALDEERTLPQISSLAHLHLNSPSANLLVEAVADAYKRLLRSSIESDLRIDLKQAADREAVDVFASNLRQLLLASPMGARSIIGIDPGIRTGCKCAALDETGKYLDSCTIYPNIDEQRAAREFTAFFSKFPSHAVAIGNGTAGRETEALVRKVCAELPEQQRPIVVMVSEAGASVYSASDIAREEFPDLDLTIRGAISIARRLQDPLAELVKIDPKSIGVGQYQHDVFQPLLKRKLDEVVESCVNLVGVELNTASAALLRYVAGIGPGMAKKIVAHRDANGQFATRQSLLKVPGLGPKTFEQAAGFLRVKSSKNPLDASAVHPERYSVVERMASDLKVELPTLIGNDSLISSINLQNYMASDIGMPTLVDIVEELKKPGRDPRAQFEAPKFDDSVREIKDLKEGMILNGIVTNVTNFGAFVDIGVHQDGLVHISALADRFVSNPSDVVKVGDAVRVRVIEVDVARSRIALSCRLSDAPQKTGKDDAQRPRSGQRRGSKKGKSDSSDNAKFGHNPFAALKK